MEYPGLIIGHPNPSLGYPGQYPKYLGFQNGCLNPCPEYPDLYPDYLEFLFLLPQDIWSSSKLTSLSRCRVLDPWLTLNFGMTMHFLIWITRGAQRYLSQVERGKSHLDCPCLIACFFANPKTTFITIQLRSSVWWLLNKSIHILSTCDNLRFKDTTYILCNEKSPSLVLGQFGLMSDMSSHY